jgi:hypothetical protein
LSLYASIIGDDPGQSPDPEDLDHGQVPGRESNNQADAITIRPFRLERRNIDLPALGNRETPAVIRKRGIRQRWLRFLPHFRDRREYENFLSN